MLSKKRDSNIKNQGMLPWTGEAVKGKAPGHSARKELGIAGMHSGQELAKSVCLFHTLLIAIFAWERQADLLPSTRRDSFSLHFLFQLNPPSGYGRQLKLLTFLRMMPLVASDVVRDTTHSGSIRNDSSRRVKVAKKRSLHNFSCPFNSGPGEHYNKLY